MNKIELIVVGNLKEKGYKLLEQEYIKRLSKYCKFKLVTIKDESNNLDSKVVLLKEGNKILKILDRKSYIICLDLNKDELTSQEFAKKITTISTFHNSKISFIIGGSVGIDQRIKDLANYSLSFSKMTFAHNLFRIIFLEQLYRSYKINEGSNYHK